MLGARADGRAARRAAPARSCSLKGDGWYDYEAKYADGGMELVVPPRISDVAIERVRSLAVRAFRLAGCSGLARADFFVDGDEVLLNELNTMPGFTPTSVYAKLWEASGAAVPGPVDRLVAIAVERYAEERGTGSRAACRQQRAVSGPEAEQPDLGDRDDEPPGGSFVIHTR